MKPHILATLVLCAPVAMAQTTDIPGYSSASATVIDNHVTGYTVFGNVYEVQRADGSSERGVITGDSSSPIQVVSPDSGGGGFIFNAGNGYSRYFGH